jgi:gliding motility-associated-like protein
MPAGPVMYTVTGTDANGCTKSDNVQVGLHPQPVINAGADLTVCLNQSVQLSVTGGQQYTWSPSSYLSCTNCPDPVATPLQDITYTVTGTDANGCTDSDKITVAVIQMLPITIGPGDTLCEGESTQLNASGGDTYLWIPATGLDNNTSANPIATPAATTNYYVVVKQGSCFTDTSRVTVVVHPKPTVNAGADHTMLAGSPVNLFANATHTTEYLWSPADDLSCFDCQSPVATPKRTTSYTVFVSNEYGCKAQDDVTVFVECDKSLLFLANTFTPNGDGHNDRFYPQGKGVSSVQRFRIYNRWGELIYDVQNITLNSEMNGWDGTYKGEQLRPDVFVYILDAICDTGEPMQVKGDISLIR